MAFDQRKAGLLDRMNPDSQSSLLGQEFIRLWNALEILEAKVAAIQLEESGGKEFFSGTARISAITANTRVHVIPEIEIPQGKNLRPLGFIMLLDGETAWSGETGTALYIADSGIDSIYRFASIPANLMSAGNFITAHMEGVTLEAEFGMVIGCREGKGIDVLADGNFASGSDCVVTVYGYME